MARKSAIQMVIVVWVLSASADLLADIRLPAVLSDNMVLQQRSSASLVLQDG